MRHSVHLSYRATREVKLNKVKKIVSAIIVVSICLLAIFF